MAVSDRAWVALLVSASACAHARPSSPPVDVSPAPGDAASTLRTNRAEIETGPPRPAKLEVTEAEGAGAGQLQTLFGPAAEPLHRCLPGQYPGKLMLRVTRKDGVLSVSPVAGSTLDDAGRSCALEALSKIHLPETGSNAGGVSIPPPGFTSLLTIVW